MDQGVQDNFSHYKDDFFVVNVPVEGTFYRRVVNSGYMNFSLFGRLKTPVTKDFYKSERPYTVGLNRFLYSCRRPRVDIW